MSLIARRTSGFAASAAIHAAVAAMLLYSVSPATRSAELTTRRNASEQNVRIFVAPPPPQGLPGLRPTTDIDHNSDERIPDRQAVLSIPGLTLNFQKVAKRAKLLFPLITPGLALEQFLPADFTDRPALSNSFVRFGADDSGVRPPLFADPSARQTLVDEAWSRHERWQAFQHLAPTVAKYNSNDGDLPRVLQMYFEQNGLQPFVDAGAPDQRVWTQLAIAADHVDFIGFISQYTAARQASKSTTSLLLVLDTLIQSNLDVLLTLLALEPQTDLTLTRRTNRAAFDFLVDTREHCRAELAKKQLTSPEAVRGYYEAIRLALLDTVIRTSPDGYRAGDARYLMGVIYWRQGNVDAALGEWQAIHRNDSDSYAFVYISIQTALADRANFRLMKSAIDRALSLEMSRWRSMSYDRLQKFGYRFNTF